MDACAVLTYVADSEEERDAWTEAIRQTKAQLFVSFNAMHPDSMLTSPANTTHLRHSLQVLPFLPSDERLALHQGKQPKGKDKGKQPLERQGRVEHWVPAIWIPDEKTGVHAVQKAVWVAMSLGRRSSAMP
jgi:hypothetical protein